jgi:tetratricopeptide (TPR) repeat protein
MKSTTNLQWLLASFALSCVSVPAKAVRPLARSDHQTWATVGILVQQTPSNEANELFQAAISLYRQGKFEEALANCAKASTLNPNDFRPHALTGYVYLAQRKLKSASEAFAEAIRLHPQLKELYLAKAEADFLRNAHEEALEACRKATKVDPNYAEAYSMIGELLRFDKERRPEAIAALRSAIRINPELPQPYHFLGEILESAHDEKGAEEVFRQGMAADPKHMGGRFALGRMLVKQGRLVEARELWGGRTSDEDRTYPQFITLLKRAENLKRATDNLAQKPNDPDVLTEMGLAVMEGDSWVFDGRQKRAIVYFKKALELKPDYTRAQYGIVKAYIQIAYVFKDEGKNVDRELAKLRQLDPKLADELEEYRKKYVGGLVASPPVKEH